MPSRSTRRIKSLPRGTDPAGSSSEQAHADDDPSSHVRRPASGPIDQDHASTSSAQHEEEYEEEEPEVEEPIIRTSHTFEADISAFEPPNAFESSSRSTRRESTSPPSQQQRSIQVQIAVGRERNASSGRRSYYPDADYPARTSYPIQGRDDIVQTTSQHQQLVAHTPSRATIAPPVVTRDVTQRREETTFGSSSSISPVKKSSFNRKQKYVHHQHHPSATTGVDKNLSASSSSEIDEETTRRGRVMELFSPPSPSSLRTSRRQQQMHYEHHESDSLAAAVTTSTSLDPSVGTFFHLSFFRLTMFICMTYLVH